MEDVYVGRGSELMGRASGWWNYRDKGKTGRSQQASGVENPSLPGLMWVPGRMVELLVEKRRSRAFGPQEEFLRGQAELKARYWARRLG